MGKFGSGHCSNFSSQFRQNIPYMSSFNKVGPDLNEKGDGNEENKIEETENKKSGEMSDRQEVYKSQENPNFDRMESESTFVGKMDSIRQILPDEIGLLYRIYIHII